MTELEWCDTVPMQYSDMCWSFATTIIQMPSFKLNTHRATQLTINGSDVCMLTTYRVNRWQEESFFELRKIQHWSDVLGMFKLLGQ